MQRLIRRESSKGIPNIIKQTVTSGENKTTVSITETCLCLWRQWNIAFMRFKSRHINSRMHIIQAYVASAKGVI